MRSPFPGMNPYLEHPLVWHDFRESMLPDLRQQLNAQLPTEYVVRIDEHMFVHDAGDERLLVGRGDVGVHSVQRTFGSLAIARAAAPAEADLPAEDFEGISFLEIRDRDNFDLITVIEVLSHANKKPGESRAAFYHKRRNLFRAAVNVVEIVLLRAWPPFPPAEGTATFDYRCLVSRWPERPRAGLWPISLEDPIPMLPIPLKEGEAEPRLDVQSALHRIDDAAGYDRYIYRRPVEPPLSPARTAWADALVAKLR